MAYLVPAEEIRKEMIIKGSRFITTLGPVFTLEEAKEFLQRIRTEFRDATHNVPAYLVGGGRSVLAHASDDGEPSGTAGRPALAVLRGSGLGDVAVMVTRYFGGTKLGTGGLVRAYTQAVQEVVAVVPRAEKVTADTFLLTLPYALLERVRLLVNTCNGEILETTFGADVTMTLRFRVEAGASFQNRLRELSSGQLKAVFIETAEVLYKG